MMGWTWNSINWASDNVPCLNKENIYIKSIIGSRLALMKRLNYLFSDGFYWLRGKLIVVAFLLTNVIGLKSNEYSLSFENFLAVVSRGYHLNNSFHFDLIDIEECWVARAIPFQGGGLSALWWVKALYFTFLLALNSVSGTMQAAHLNGLHFSRNFIISISSFNCYRFNHCKLIYSFWLFYIWNTAIDIFRTPDSFFYEAPRFVTHIDDPAIAALTKYYSQVFPPSNTPGISILDMCSSWVRHIESVWLCQ